MSRFEWLLILFVLGVIQVLCFWGIDISVSAMLSSPRAVLSNGWSIRSPNLMYHISLYISTFVTVSIVIVSVHIVQKYTERKAENHNKEFVGDETQTISNKT